MRLYRQARPGQDWSDVVERIAADLADLVRSSSDRVPRDDGIPERPPANEIETSRAGPPDPPAHGFNELAACRSGLMLYNRNDIYIGASLRKYGEFSAEETALFRILVQPGRTVLDIGANIGVHTIDLSHLVGPAGIVHAFEPQRLVFQTLCANVALNSRANVVTHQAAVGAANGATLVPWLDPGEPANYGGLSLLGSPLGEPVPLLTIDSLGLGECQFIKLDIEGMETEALRGGVGTIERCRPIIYVENDRQDRSAALIALLQRYRYRLYWHLPPLYSATNFRSDSENIFGDTVSVNMICIPAEIPQASLTNLREVTGAGDIVMNR